MTATADAESAPKRVLGLDALRGVAVVGMLFVDNKGSNAITDQLQHAPWHGIRAADVVFPLFLFAVGASLRFSRRANQPKAVAARTAKLFALGILIVLLKYHFNTFGFGVLGHIAAAYGLCWVITRLPRWAQYTVVAAILVGFGILYALVPVPGTSTTGTGQSTSWAMWIDQALGLDFSAEAPHSYPTSAVSAYFGYLAGGALTGDRAAVVRRLALLTLGALVLGVAFDLVIPANKRLWTPTYVLLTTAIALIVLIVLYLMIDVLGVVRPWGPFIQLGENALVAFVVSELVFRTALEPLQAPVVEWITGWSNATVAGYAYPVLTIVAIWALCAWLARKRIIIKL